MFLSPSPLPSATGGSQGLLQVGSAVVWGGLGGSPWVLSPAFLGCPVPATLALEAGHGPLPLPPPLVQSGHGLRR